MVSGTPLIYKNKMNYAIILFIIFIYSVLLLNNRISLAPLHAIKTFALTFIFIYLIQFFILGDASWLGLFNNLLKMFFFSFVLLLLGDKFKYYYFNLMFYLSLFGLFYWSWFAIAGITVDLIPEGGMSNLIIANFEKETLRNCGPFWEPGAYGGYLMLIPLFFLNEIEYLKKHWIKTSILILSLLSSMSTTAYIALGLYFGYLTFKSKLKILLVPVFLLISVVVYSGFSFLKEKVIIEIERAEDLDGEYHGQRFAVLLFDLHYIQKHPLIGNGFLESTRYADHPYLIEAFKKGEVEGHGNGFSNFIASMGFVTFIMYFFLIYKRNKCHMKKMDLFFYMSMIALLLNGEQFLYYPIYLGLPFLSLKNNTDDVNEKNSRSINRP
jgi:hypothetical protein